MANGVFEGGGVRGIAHVGALQIAEEIGIKWDRVAGTSAGAIIAALVAAGYTVKELQLIMTRLDFNDFKDTDWIDHIPFLGKPLSLLSEGGIYEGNFFQEWMATLLAEKGVITFGDLKTPLKVIASDLTRRQMIVLPDDLPLYGFAPDDFSVAMAVRMSMGIPLYFEPIRLFHHHLNLECLIVDGGICSNFPLFLFKPLGETFGFKLIQDDSGPKVIDGHRDYISALVETTMDAGDNRHIKTTDFKNTIAIPTGGISSVDFDLTAEDKERLLQSGRNAAKQFWEI